MFNVPAPKMAEQDDSRMLRLKRELHQRLISGMNLSAVGTFNDDELREELRRGAEQLCSNSADLLSHREREQLIDDLLNETLGLGPLTPLLNDPTVSDILINGPQVVYVERRGVLERTNVVFNDEQHLVETVQRIASRVGRRIDESSPMVDARLPDGSRVNAVIRPLALDGALVSIRRFSAHPLNAMDLISRKTATPEMLEFLGACVKARMNIMISGGTGSGKTTLLNLLSGYISPTERIATIEDAAELQLQQPHVARMETRPANLEDKGAVTARDLLKNSLRMRPDRIVVGECRGAEAFDMLQAMTTGHAGSLTTIHANDSRESINRLEMLVGMAGYELPIWLIRRQISTAIQIIVQTSRLPGGGRKIMQISEVTGMEQDVINMHDIFRYHQTGVDENKTAQGEFQTTGIRPQCLPKLQAAGISLPPNFFESREMAASRVDQVAFRETFK